ncbi:PLP-dependent cysteine synthase family protein [Actinoplanes awajinensis]|uniref:Cystathionine beta-synthase n=1 Tax=Actinoplanes awajinensis subsp. mycoplanecinus TaxID=135947 RepID=A0A0X3VA36_9ACTN|nr:pyridoxal-phosphate dependent enzyme [Actinoplanes awajinensis]KUL41620.1 cystathionine beta-synthase [Actinoplanes awajinensis subsp. mycoplanecinus]
MSVLDAIGDTPLIRLTRVTAGIAAEVHLKAEFLNPGGSVKDRAALAMVEAAEESGELRPGGVIVEGTSGNTGIGLAMIAAQRGYRALVVVPDKSSAEKVATLRAYGAEVVITVGGVPREDPRHVSQVAARLAAETPGGWLAGQYDNPANPGAHRATTGPEIWRQTGRRVTHFVAGVGTGGTISGTGAFLRSAGPVTIVGADPENSVYGGGDGSPYYVESIGHYVHPATAEDVWPESYHPHVVDRIERVGDRESIEMTRRLAREEGVLVGASTGTAVVAALRVARELGPDGLVVVLAPDSGRAYLSKYFDDGWLRRNGFPAPVARGSLAAASPGSGAHAAPGSAASPGPLVGDIPISAAVLLPVTARVRDLPAAARVPARPADQVTGRPVASVALVVLPRGDRPLTDPAPGDVVGAVPLDALVHAAPSALLTDVAQPPLPTVGIGESSAEALGRTPAAATWVAVLTDGRITGVITRSALAATSSRDAAAAVH